MQFNNTTMQAYNVFSEQAMMLQVELENL